MFMPWVSNPGQHITKQKQQIHATIPKNENQHPSILFPPWPNLPNNWFNPKILVDVCSILRTHPPKKRGRHLPFPLLPRPLGLHLLNGLAIAQHKAKGESTHDASMYPDAPWDWNVYLGNTRKYHKFEVNCRWIFHTWSIWGMVYLPIIYLHRSPTNQPFW